MRSTGRTFDDAGKLIVPLNAQLQLPLDAIMVIRLNELALHSWDVYVAFDPNVEVGSYAADLLVDHYPREIISMVASRLVAGRLGKAALRVDIGSSRRTLVMT